MLMVSKVKNSLKEASLWFLGAASPLAPVHFSKLLPLYFPITLHNDMHMNHDPNLTVAPKIQRYSITTQTCTSVYTTLS
jgi:hypothetical protein